MCVVASFVHFQTCYASYRRRRQPECYFLVCCRSCIGACRRCLVLKGTHRQKCIMHSTTGAGCLITWVSLSLFLSEHWNAPFASVPKSMAKSETFVPIVVGRFCQNHPRVRPWTDELTLGGLAEDKKRSAFVWSGYVCVYVQ